MSGQYSSPTWRESIHDTAIECSLDIAVHSADSDVVLLTVPGVNGSVDGYYEKYVRIADSVQSQFGSAVVRMSNPYIGSYFWESNLR